VCKPYVHHFITLLQLLAALLLGLVVLPEHGYSVVNLHLIFALGLGYTRVIEHDAIDTSPDALGSTVMASLEGCG